MLIPIKQMILESNNANNTDGVKEGKENTSYIYPIYPNYTKPTKLNPGNQGTKDGSKNNPNISPNTADLVHPSTKEYTKQLFTKVTLVK